MIRRIFAAALTCALLSSCAGGAGLFGPSTGTVSGHVIARACGGADQEDQPACRSTPLAGVRLTFAGSTQSRSVTVQTDAGGAYGVQLQPGQYTVQVTAPASKAPAAAAGAGHRLTGPSSVTVTAGRTTSANYAFTILLL